MWNVLYILAIIGVIHCDVIIIEPGQIQSYWCYQGGIQAKIESPIGLDIDVYDIETVFTSNTDITSYSDMLTSNQVIRIDVINGKFVRISDVIINISCFVSDEFNNLCDSSTGNYAIIGFLVVLLFGFIVILVIVFIVMRFRKNEAEFVDIRLE